MDLLLQIKLIITDQGCNTSVWVFLGSVRLNTEQMQRLELNLKLSPTTGGHLAEQGS